MMKPYTWPSSIGRLFASFQVKTKKLVASNTTFRGHLRASQSLLHMRLPAWCCTPADVCLCWSSSLLQYLGEQIPKSLDGLPKWVALCCWGCCSPQRHDMSCVALVRRILGSLPLAYIWHRWESAQVKVSQSLCILARLFPPTMSPVWNFEHWLHQHHLCNDVSHNHGYL